MENVGKHRDTKLVTTRVRWNYLVSEPSSHAKMFLEKFVRNRIGKTQTGDTVNYYYKSVHHPIPTRENKGHTGNFQNK